MPQVIQYIDPDASGAGNGDTWTDAYNSMNAWEAAEQTDLQSDGDYHTAYTRSSGSPGTADTTSATINTWNPGPSNYVEVIGNDFPTDAIYDGTKYRLHNNDSDQYMLWLYDEYVRVRNLQILVTQTSTNERNGIIVGSIAGGGSDIRVDSCIFKGVCSDNGKGVGIVVNDADATVNIYNTLIYDFVSGADADFMGVWVVTNTAVNIYNCTVYNCYYGIFESVGTATVTNCAVGNCADDFGGGGLTKTYCCSDDGDGTNSQGPSGGSWANEFNNIGGEDFSLKAGNCHNNGTDNPGSGLYSDDIAKASRTSTWDIGAFEYGLSIGPKLHHYQQIGGL